MVDTVRVRSPALAKLLPCTYIRSAPHGCYWSFECDLPTFYFKPGVGPFGLTVGGSFSSDCSPDDEDKCYYEGCISITLSLKVSFLPDDWNELELGSLTGCIGGHSLPSCGNPAAEGSQLMYSLSIAVAPGPFDVAGTLYLFDANPGLPEGHWTTLKDFGVGDNDKPGGCVDAIFHTESMNWGSEIYWHIGDNIAEGVEKNTLGNYEKHTKVMCLPVGDTTVTLGDSYGDGWHGGSLKVTTEGTDGQDVELAITGNTQVSGYGHDITVKVPNGVGTVKVPYYGKGDWYNCKNNLFGLSSSDGHRGGQPQTQRLLVEIDFDAWFFTINIFNGYIMPWY